MIEYDYQVTLTYFQGHWRFVFKALRFEYIILFIVLLYIQQMQKSQNYSIILDQSKFKICRLVICMWWLFIIREWPFNAGGGQENLVGDPFFTCNKKSPHPPTKMHKKIPPPSMNSYFIYPNSTVFHENTLMTFVKNVCQWRIKKIQSPPSGTENNSLDILAR